MFTKRYAAGNYGDTFEPIFVELAVGSVCGERISPAGLMGIFENIKGRAPRHASEVDLENVVLSTLHVSPPSMLNLADEHVWVDALKAALAGKLFRAKVSREGVRSAIEALQALLVEGPR